MLDRAVLFEVEDALLDVVAEVEITVVLQNLILLCGCQSDDFAGRRNDAGFGDQSDSEWVRQQATKLHLGMFKQLTPEQIAEARKLAREWTPKK